MFIVWGRKVVRRKLGYIADFCPVCRELRPFTLNVVRRVSHVYYIPLGRGDELGHDRTCQECRTLYQAKDTTYLQVARRQMPFEELKRVTHPTLDAVIRDRLELEHRVRNGRLKLSPADRFAWIKAPFMYLSPRVEWRFASTHIDKEVGLAIIATLVLPFVVGNVTSAYFPDVTPQATAISICAGLSVIIWQLIGSGSRFMRREIIPVLARSLAPLQPTQQELEAVINEIRQGTHKIGRKVKPEQVLEQIHASVGAIGGVPRLLG
jgi:hypothetical protein